MHFCFGGRSKEEGSDSQKESCDQTVMTTVTGNGRQQSTRACRSLGQPSEMYFLAVNSFGTRQIT